MIGEDTSLNALQNLDPKKAMVDFKAVFDKVKGDQKRSVIVSGRVPENKKVFRLLVLTLYF